jgi:hypothetical protein
LRQLGKLVPPRWQEWDTSPGAPLIADFFTEKLPGMKALWE